MPITTAAGALAMLVPPLYALGSGVYQDWLDWSATRLADADQGWDDQYYAAQALYAGHLWTRIAGGVSALTETEVSEVGNVTSRGAADLSESYGSLAAGMSLEAQELATTRYGVAFLALRQSIPNFGARVTGPYLGSYGQ